MVFIPLLYYVPNLCARARIRTWDPTSISGVLYQLSYTRILILISLENIAEMTLKCNKNMKMGTTREMNCVGARLGQTTAVMRFWKRYSEAVVVTGNSAHTTSNSSILLLKCELPCRAAFISVRNMPRWGFRGVRVMSVEKSTATTTESVLRLSTFIFYQWFIFQLKIRSSFFISGVIEERSD